MSVGTSSYFHGHIFSFQFPFFFCLHIQMYWLLEPSSCNKHCIICLLQVRHRFTTVCTVHEMWFWSRSRMFVFENPMWNYIPHQTHFHRKSNPCDVFCEWHRSQILRSVQYRASQRKHNTSSNQNHIKLIIPWLSFVPKCRALSPVALNRYYCIIILSGNYIPEKS